jgi:hypothetical protein
MIDATCGSGEQLRQGVTSTAFSQTLYTFIDPCDSNEKHPAVRLSVCLFLMKDEMLNNDAELRCSCRDKPMGNLSGIIPCRLRLV